MAVNIQTDAVLEGDDDQVIPNHEDDEVDMNVLLKSRAQQETSVSRDDVATNQLHTAQSNNLIDYLPKHLREEYIDMLVLHTDDDYDEAKTIKELIEREVKFCRGLKPNVVLLNDVVTDHPVQLLDYAYSRSLYILMFVTKNFCDDFEKLSESHACLVKALKSREERKVIIPVHTRTEQNRNYKLPMMLDGLRALNYFSKKFINDVTNLFKHKSDLILERKNSLIEEREKYFKANPKIMVAQSNLEKQFESSVIISGSKSNDKSQSTAIVEHQTKACKVDAEILQPLRQCPLSTEQKTFIDLENEMSSIELDGDATEQHMNRQQHVQQRHSGSHTSFVNIKKDPNEGNYYSSTVEVPTVNFSSLPEPDGDKAVSTDVAAQVHSTRAQAAFSFKKSTSNSASINLGSNLQSVQTDKNENKEDPSTDGSCANNSTSQETSTKPSITPAPIYHIHINHADFVAINSQVHRVRSSNKNQDTEHSSDDDSETPDSKMEDEQFTF